MQSTLPSLFIVGPMGAGKTTVGKLLAKHLGRDFIDSDHYICEQTGADIPWIFEKEGETGFREREARAIAELTALPNVVLATGGGVVMQPQNRDNLTKQGITIYLRANVDVQLKRTAKDKSRPLLNTPNPRAVLQSLFDVRDPLYREVADIVVETGDGYPRYMLKKIIEALKQHYPEHMKS
ncbi:shikimate kinase [Psychrobacter sp. YP14]|uniref:Shikimate kinase n=3 Tax=Psychrobacter TaxID=497 RepID=AROK_PSYWF|nr:MULTISPECIES: shikimate kinase [Psychrobacter]A5WCG4.1 RecName: Full=Shikimate kinase; Short=SK [Psychrobacter sp. PRwf-1]AWT48434.1 shikimate kinase [Psychrobacter sp. YP14]MUG31430.1 AAA family ATPase [Psychrobacter sanguinis]